MGIFSTFFFFITVTDSDCKQLVRSEIFVAEFLKLVNDQILSRIFFSLIIRNFCGH